MIMVRIRPAGWCRISSRHAMAAYAGNIDRRKGRKEGGRGRKEGGSSNRAEEKREGRFLKSQWLGVRILKKKAITVHETASGLFIGHYGLRGRLDGLIIEKY